MTINVSNACSAKLRQYGSVSGGEMKETSCVYLHISQIGGRYSDACFFTNKA